MLRLEEHELLKQFAHQSWIERGRPDGSPEIDWLRAKDMLIAYRARGIQTLDSAMLDGRSEPPVLVVDSKLQKRSPQRSNRQAARTKRPRYK